MRLLVKRGDDVFEVAADGAARRFDQAEIDAGLNQGAIDADAFAINIGGRVIQFEPDAPSSGMTLQQVDNLPPGFMIGSVGIASQEELRRTLLQEIFRLDMNQNASGASQEEIADFTGDAFNFAQSAGRVLDDIEP